MIVVVAPVPAIDPGLRTQVPVAGSPLKTTLPVGAIHVEGCVIVPTIGANGPPGASLIITSVDGREIHPASVVIVNL